MVELKAVPREPTAEMIEAGQRCLATMRVSRYDAWDGPADMLAALHRVMYDAAPAVPVNAPAEGEDDVARELLADTQDWGSREQRLEWIARAEAGSGTGLGSSVNVRDALAAIRRTGQDYRQPARGEDSLNECPMCGKPRIAVCECK